MRKVLFVAFVVMAFMAMGAFAAFACEGNAACSYSAKTASVNSGCSLSQTTTKLASSGTKSKLISGGSYSKSSCSIGNRSASSIKNSTIASKFAATTCSPENMEACMAYAKTKHAEVCKYGSECQITSMSIKGMTCGACENGVKAAFMNVDAVNKVLEVCYKAGFAVVCTNPEEASDEVLMKAVSARGFEAEIIPAVATVTTDAKLSNTNSGLKACRAAKKAKNIKASAEGTN